MNKRKVMSVLPGSAKQNLLFPVNMVNVCMPFLQAIASCQRTWDTHVLWVSVSLRKLYTADLVLFHGLLHTRLYHALCWGSSPGVLVCWFLGLVCIFIADYTPRKSAESALGAGQEGARPSFPASSLFPSCSFWGQAQANWTQRSTIIPYSSQATKTNPSKNQPKKACLDLYQLKATRNKGS